MRTHSPLPPNLLHIMNLQMQKNRQLRAQLSGTQAAGPRGGRCHDPRHGVRKWENRLGTS